MGVTLKDEKIIDRWSTITENAQGQNEKLCFDT